MSDEELESAAAMEGFHNLAFYFADYFTTHTVPSFPSQDARSRPEARSKAAKISTSTWLCFGAVERLGVYVPAATCTRPER